MFGKQVVQLSKKFFACFLALMLAINTVALPLAFAEEEQNPPPAAIDDVYLDDDNVIHWPTNLVLPAIDGEYATDNIIVVFKRDITVNQAYAALEDVGLFDITKEEFTITQEIIDKQRIYSAYLKDGVTVSDALTKVFAQPNVDWAEANGFVRLDSDFDVEEASEPEYIPQDPDASYSSPKAWINLINAVSAWQLRASFQQTYVGVIDGGIDASHPDLKANLAMQYSHDFAGNKDTQLGATGDPSHGTHVAGIISAQVNNGIGIAGVSHNAKLIPVNVFKFDNDGYFAETIDIIQAINYLTDLPLNNLRVINMSLGNYTPCTAEHAAIQRAQSEGILVVCAAGNNRTSNLHYPSDYDECVSVIALNESADKRDTKNSNYGAEKDISAPGTGIYSTVNPHTYVLMSGTSMASPMVAGAAALLFSYKPSLTVAQVKKILYDSATDLDVKGKDIQTGAGRLDVGAALGLLVTPHFKRLEGITRYGTMEKISKAKASSSSTAIIASADKYPDALCASALAGIYDASILLTYTDPTMSLAPETRAEINRLKVKKIIIVGSVASVSKKAENELAVLVGSSNVSRFGGENRLATACEIYNSNASSYSKTAFIASGETFPDALSISPYAFKNKSPIFMTDATGLLNQQTIDTMKGANFTEIVFLGGVDRVSDTVKTQLGTGYSFTRLSGAHRYETSGVIADWGRARGLSLSHVTLTTGENFPDALCGGPLCGKNSSVLLLVNDTVGGYTALDHVLNSAGGFITQGYILGDKNSVSVAAAAHAETKILVGS